MTDRQSPAAALRVLMLAPTPFFADRGCHVRIYEEARVLSAMGHEPLIVTYHIGRDLPGIAIRRIPAVPWYKKLAAGPSWHKPYLDILLFFKAISAIRTFRPHLIHAHLHEGAFIALALKAFFRLPLIFDCQGSLTTEMLDHRFMRRGGLRHAFFRMVERIVNAGADFILTSSGFGSHDLRENWGVAPERVQELIDGVDTEMFRPYPRADARRELGLTTEDPIVAFLGVLNSYQGADILLQTARIFEERRIPGHFLIMGFPHERYEEEARRMGISHRVTFTGRVDYARTPLYLSAADVAVSPKVSLTEANGKLFNYMACRIPSVVFDTPINREILGETGVYVPYGDAAAFAAELQRLLADPQLRRDLGESARQRAVQVHSWETRGRELAAIYRRVIER